MGVGRLPVVGRERLLSALASRLPTSAGREVFAFYSSALGGISTEPALAAVPLDDHGFHRGHAVFDTCNVHQGRAYGLGFHLDRLIRSAEDARIKSLPDKEDLRSIVLQTIAATRRADGVFVRYWLTAGRGNFEVSPRNCEVPCCFYVVAHADSHTTEGPRGKKAAIVDVPLKPPLLATMKSNNYMLNAHVAMEAEAHGADLGIQLDEDGRLAESSISTIAIVKEGTLISPPADRILASTSWLRARALTPMLVSKGILRGDVEAHVYMNDLWSASEILSLGGGWVAPVIALNGQPVGDGEPGPVFLALDEALRADFSNLSLTDEVPYSPPLTTLASARRQRS